MEPREMTREERAAVTVEARAWAKAQAAERRRAWHRERRRERADLREIVESLRADGGL